MLAHGKSQNVLKMGHCLDQKWVNNGSKKQFPKTYPRPFGVLKPVFLAQFEPVVMRFWPTEKPKML